MGGHGGAGAHVDVAVPVEGVVLRCSAVGLGPVVVLLHAGGERRSVWKPVAERVAAQGFRVISVDQRGHGETKGPVARTLEPYAIDLRGLLASLDTPVHLVGAPIPPALATSCAASKSMTRRRAARDGIGPSSRTSWPVGRICSKWPPACVSRSPWCEVQKARSCGARTHSG